MDPEVWGTNIYPIQFNNLLNAVVGIFQQSWTVQFSFAKLKCGIRTPSQNYRYERDQHVSEDCLKARYLRLPYIAHSGCSSASQYSSNLYGSDSFPGLVRLLLFKLEVPGLHLGRPVWVNLDSLFFFSPTQLSCTIQILVCYIGASKCLQNGSSCTSEWLEQYIQGACFRVWQQPVTSHTSLFW